MIFLNIFAPALKVIACIIIEAALADTLAFIVENAADGFESMTPRLIAPAPVMAPLE